MPADFAFQGLPGAATFSQLVRTIHQHKLSGSLTLTQGTIKRIIQFAAGDVCGTASNQPQDALSHLLVSRGWLSQSAMDEIRAQTPSDQSQIQSLLEHSNLSQEVLAQAQLEQVASLFASLCEWEEGEFDFTETEKAATSAGFAVPDLLLHAARQTSATDRLQQLLGDDQTNLEMAAGSLEQFAHFRLQSHEGYLLTRLDRPMTMGELRLSSGLSEAETLRGLYALKCAGLVVVNKPAAMLTAVPITTKAQPASAPAQEQTAAAASAASATVAQAEIPVPDEPKKKSSDEATMEDIVQMARLVAESDDDFAILGLTPHATRADIKSAYTRMAKMYHPDRHQSTADAATLQSLKEIFARVRKAYVQLREHEPVASETPMVQTQPASNPVPPPVSPEPQPQPREEAKQAESAPAEPVIERHTHSSEPAIERHTHSSEPVIERPSHSAVKTEIRQEPILEHYDHGTTAAPAYNVSSVAFETSASDQQPTSASSSASAQTFDSSAVPVIPAPTIADLIPPEVAHETSAAAEAAAIVSEPETEEPDEPIISAEEAVHQTATLNFQYAVARYQEGDLPGAVELMNSAVQLEPQNAFYHDQLATLLAINPRRRKEAETHLLRAIEIEPQNPEWTLHLAMLYKKVGLPSRAETQLKKALSLDPQHEMAKKELRAVQALKNGQSSTGSEKKAAAKEQSAGDLLAKAKDTSVSDLLAKAKDTSVTDLVSKFFKRK